MHVIFIHIDANLCFLVVASSWNMVLELQSHKEDSWQYNWCTLRPVGKLLFETAAHCPGEIS
jgi:hypothetical protein